MIMHIPRGIVTEDRDQMWRGLVVGCEASMMYQHGHVVPEKCSSIHWFRLLTIHGYDFLPLPPTHRASPPPAALNCEQLRDNMIQTNKHQPIQERRTCPQQEKKRLRTLISGAVPRFSSGTAALERAPNGDQLSQDSDCLSRRAEPSTPRSGCSIRLRE